MSEMKTLLPGATLGLLGGGSLTKLLLFLLKGLFG